MKKILFYLTLAVTAFTAQVRAETVTFSFSAANIYGRDGDTKFSGDVTIKSAEFPDFSATGYCLDGNFIVTKTFEDDDYEDWKTYTFYFTFTDGDLAFFSDNSVRVYAADTSFSVPTVSNVGFGDMTSQTQDASNWTEPGSTRLVKAIGEPAAGGSITVPQGVPPGEMVNIDVVPNPGYFVSDASSDPEAEIAIAAGVEGHVTVAVMAPAGKTKVTVKYGVTKYGIAIADPEHGTVTTKPAESAAAGETVEITAAPDEGYVRDEMTVTTDEGNPVEVTPTGTGGTFVMPPIAVEVEVTFRELEPHSIFIMAGEGGTISADPVTAKKGEKVTLNVTPWEHYLYVESSLQVKGDSGDPVETTRTSENEFTFVMPDEDVVVSAQFEGESYQITVNTQGGTPMEPLNYKYSVMNTTEFYLEQPTKEGYEFAGWSGSEQDPTASLPEGLSIEDTTLVVDAGTYGDKTIYAHWTEVQYGISTAATEHGTIGAPTSAKEDATVIVTTTPAAGYKRGTITVAKTDGSGMVVVTPTETGCTFTMPACAVTVAATFWEVLPEITGVKALQRYPWNGLVDIDYTLSEDLSAKYRLEVLAANGADTNKAMTVTFASDALAKGTHRLTWDMNADEFTYVAEGVVFIVAAVPKDSVQLWKNGPYFATTNVGATQQGDFGYYFWWGDTVGYKRNAQNNGWISVKDGTAFSFDADHCPTWEKNGTWLKNNGYIDSKGNLVATHDAATANLGELWRTMTLGELSQLLDTKNCTRTWTQNWEGTGKNGYVVTGVQTGYQGGSIFLPAAGYGSESANSGTNLVGDYSDSTMDSNVQKAGVLNFSSVNFRWMGYSRAWGYTIRPVWSGTPAGASDPVALDLRTGEVRNATSGEAETLTFTTNYPGGAVAGATVDITVNGAAWKTGLTGEGTVEWTPTLAGTNELHHIVKSGATEITNLVAKFYLPPPLVQVTTLSREGTELWGIYTNGVDVAVVPGKGYMVVSNATVDVEFRAKAEFGCFFKDGTDYSSYATNTVTASEDPTEVTGPSPVQGKSCGGSAYAFLDDGKMTILGTGAAAFCPTEFNRNSITTVVIGDGITSVGSRFFKKAYNLQSVTGGKDLTSVGTNAFYLCTRLETITLSCTKAPEGMAGAVVSRTAIKPDGTTYVIPAVSPGYEQVLFGKAALTDEWKDLGSPEGKSIYDQGDNKFFKVDQVEEK